jgi:hypothetical protein
LFWQTVCPFLHVWHVLFPQWVEKSLDKLLHVMAKSHKYLCASASSSTPWWLSNSISSSVNEDEDCLTELSEEMRESAHWASSSTWHPLSPKSITHYYDCCYCCYSSPSNRKPIIFMTYSSGSCKKKDPLQFCYLNHSEDESSIREPCSLPPLKDAVSVFYNCCDKLPQI